jgi:hypothetical protein
VRADRDHIPGYSALTSLYSFSSPSNWGVKPHLLAVFTTRTTLPLRSAREYAAPFLSTGLKSKKVVAEDILGVVVRLRVWEVRIGKFGKACGRELRVVVAGVG